MDYHCGYGVDFVDPAGIALSLRRCF